jgi:hypothetical protein
MSEKRFNRITDAEIKAKGVQSLAIRPNMPSQYGEGGLNGKQLQARFDRLAGYIIEKYNVLVDALASHEVLDYFKLPEGYTLPTLRSLLSRVTDDAGDLIVESPYIEGKERLADIVAKIRTDIDDLYVSLGSCGGILDVASLPSENIALNSFYRVGETLYYWYDGYWHTVVNDHRLMDDVSAETARAIGEENVLRGRLDIIEPIAKSATQAISRMNYESCIWELNNAPIGEFTIGQSIMIDTLDVPDLWISNAFLSEADYTAYTYTSDEDFVNELKKGRVRIGHYSVSALETQKVDLTNYVEAYLGKNALLNFNAAGDKVELQVEGSGGGGEAYLSTTDIFTKEQFIGSKYTLIADYGNTEGNICEGQIQEETEDGFCVVIGVSLYQLQLIICAYNENYHPKYTTTSCPSKGVYLSDWRYLDRERVDSVDIQLIPTKYINNALIDLKNHPDFIAPDFSQYVKKTDYASGTAAGVVMVGASTPFAVSNGRLGINVPTTTEMKNRLASRVLPLSKLDDAVKLGLTANKFALTEAEKTSAAKWLGLPRTYADLPDKPFGTLSPITIENNYSGISYALTNGRAYKQTSIAFSPNDLIGATVGYRDGSSITETKTLASSHLVEDTPQGATFKVVDYVYIIICRSASGYEPSGIGVDTITEVGTYFSYYDDGDPYEVTYLQKDGEVVIPIEDKYIPDTIARTEYVDEAIANALASMPIYEGEYEEI